MFPFDNQSCVVTIGSFASTTESLLLEWKENSSILLQDGLKLPKFILEDYSTIDCYNVHVSGNFSCLKFRLNLVRQVQFHIVETFMPTTLLVIASWLSFWIEPTSAPGRISLACVLMLATVTLGNYAKSSLPPVSYVKALDIWFGACITFIFLVLLEYGIVTYFMRREKQSPAQSKGERKRNARPCIVCWQKVKPLALTPAAASEEDPNDKLKRPESIKIHQLVDVIARIAFPTAFFSFVVLFSTVFRFLPSSFGTI